MLLHCEVFHEVQKTHTLTQMLLLFLFGVVVCVSIGAFQKVLVLFCLLAPQEVIYNDKSPTNSICSCASVV